MGRSPAGGPAPAGHRATTQPPAEPMAAPPAGLLPQAGSEDGQPHAGSRASLSWSSRGEPPCRKAGRRERQHGKLPAGLGGTHFSCSEGPRGRTQLAGGAGADDGSLWIHLNMHPYPGHRRWGGQEPGLLYSPGEAACRRGETRDFHTWFSTVSTPWDHLLAGTCRCAVSSPRNSSFTGLGPKPTSGTFGSPRLILRRSQVWDPQLQSLPADSSFAYQL